MLKREGWVLGRNVFYRLYREEGLALRTKQPRRRKMIVHREARCKPQRPNEAWTLDFVHDQLSNGQKFRMLTVVDMFSREALAIEVGQRLRGEHVVDRSEEHTSELQSLMRISYAVFCLKKTKQNNN